MTSARQLPTAARRGLATLGLAGLALQLGACMQLPVYHLPEGQAKAQLRTTAAPGTPTLCVNHVNQRLWPDSQDLADIPAGSQVSVGTIYQAGDGRVTYTCKPQVGFTPQAGQRYISVLLVKSSACVVQVLRESPDTPTGLDWEPSLRRSDC